MSATAVQFEHTRFRCAEVKLPDAAHSREAGAALAEELDQPGLTHVFVISEGLKVNGSELVRGLTSRLPPGVAVTGGLSGDGDRFGQTLVWLERSGTTSAPTEGKVIGIGFAGGCGWATAQSAGGTPSARSAW